MKLTNHDAIQNKPPPNLKDDSRVGSVVRAAINGKSVMFGPHAQLKHKLILTGISIFYYYILYVKPQS